MLTSEYQTRLEDFRREFNRAKEAFDRSIQLDVMKAVHGIGELYALEIHTHQ